MTRIVQAANFVGPHSGGIRTMLEALGRGYRAAGHERVLIVPGPADTDEDTPAGRRITLRSPILPWSGGYRVIVDHRRLDATLERLAPERLEVSDRLTLKRVGRWGRARGIPTVAVAHERVDALLRQRLPRGLPLPARLVADLLNRDLARTFDTLVCATAWAAEELERLGTGQVRRVPLGVDLDTFRPDRASQTVHDRFAPDGAALLVYAGRLSPEKRPELAVRALARLRDRGVAAHLVVVGAGPLAGRLAAEASELPVTFTGFVADSGELATLLATADTMIAPGGVETFGLSALEALAAGTPVVTADTGALPELLTPGAGVAVPADPDRIATAVTEVLDTEPATRRAAARTRAEAFPWSATVDGMLAAHGLAPRTPSTTTVRSA